MSPRLPRIAITGGIAEGKTTVLAEIARRGHSVESSDAVARRLFELPEVQSAIAHALGLPLPLERPALRERIGADPGARRALNRVMHPLVVAEIDASPARFVEIPLLIETAGQARFERVWVVTCGPEEQLRRLRERYGDRAEAVALAASQLATATKIAFADEVIRTNTPLETVSRVVENLLLGVA